MLDLWDRQGPPVHIAVAAYMGLIKKPGAKGKKAGSTKPIDSRNPFARHAMPPKPSNDSTTTPAAASSGGSDLNDLVRMFQGSGGMI
jgi:hypothetical protein